jgi:uncharacterized membrane protein YkvA (DUF1232 family)
MKKGLFQRLFSTPFLGLYRNWLRHPKYGWMVILVSMLYLADPLDVVPDFVPVIGWLDDGVVATLLITEGSQVLTGYLKNKKSSQLSGSGVEA